MLLARSVLSLAVILSFSCSSELTTDTMPGPPDTGIEKDTGTLDIGKPDAQVDPDMTEDVGPLPDMEMDAEQDTAVDMPPVAPVFRPIGPRPVTPTPLAQGTIFAAPDGTGDVCSVAAPCDIYKATGMATSGDVVFLRGGVYEIPRNLNFTGRGANPPTIFESYPGEEAILDGSMHPPNTGVYVRVVGDPVVIRLMTFRKFPHSGISIRNSDNLLEGVTSHSNLLSGIHIHESYDTPVSNRNIIRDSITWGNSGAGLMNAEYADGGNSDGISMSSGIGNRVENCLVYDNSDDGIDTWRTTDTYVGYSIVYGSGIASGNGQGVKAGGAPPSATSFVEHNLSYNNKSAGFDFNSGVGVTFRHNTSWGNGRGYQLGGTTLTTKNIAYDTSTHGGAGDRVDNSWQREGTPTPLSTDPGSPDFLVPAGTDFSDIGAHADREQN